MCLATPVKIIKLEGSSATVDALGKKNQVDTSLLQNVKIGDYLYASRGMAIKKVSRSEAEKVLELVKKWNK
jgi:hydrogenase expression/formation protein HypC